MLYKSLLRAGFEFKRLTRRPLAARLNPFADGSRPAIIHCCYHKVGTVWFRRVLREVGAHFGLSFGSGDDYERIAAFEHSRSVDVFLDYGSHVRLDEIGDYVGSHMIRDPRDMVVSGYFYHVWTDEPWAQLPMAEYRGRSYRQHLNHLDREAGLLEEIRRMSFWVPHMIDWDYNNPRMYEIRYEDILQDEPRIMREMFTHYGFHPAAVEAACQIAEKYTFKRMSPGGSGTSHLRSGRSEEWKEHFGPAHRALFKELYPGVVSGLKYEADETW